MLTLLNPIVTGFLDNVVNLGLFSEITSCLFVYARQFIVYTYTPQYPLHQHTYSQLHPIAFLLSIVLVFWYLPQQVMFWVLFMMLGLSWSFFYNDCLWSFDAVELLAVTLFVLPLLFGHNKQFSALSMEMSVACIIFFSFNVNLSFHKFDSSLYTTMNCQYFAGPLQTFQILTTAVLLSASGLLGNRHFFRTGVMCYRSTELYNHHT